MKIWFYSCCSLCFALFSCSLSDAAPPEPAHSTSQADLDFFETSVRPLLLKECAECHGSETQWGSLRVDSRSHLLKGGDTGAAIVPGQADKSLLIEAVKRTGDYEMPPEKPLTEEEVSILVRWVNMGAPWPEETVPAGQTREELWGTHWAFQPMSHQPPPDPHKLSQPEWIITPVDQFILEKLDSKSLRPSPASERRQLIRRVTYGLTGLPPSPEEVEQFVNDSDPEAYPKLIDRLLASPHYGEHWSRRWLDLARYADTKGYVYGREETRFVHASTYRDWVVRSFNQDLPYDRFLLQQLAADQAAQDDPAAQAALGFLTLGKRFLGQTHDILDDRIDVVTRTMLGLTVSCARCHDHKYDPIPTADYYSLYGVFNNNIDTLKPVVAAESTSEKTVAFLQELQKRQDKLQQILTKKREEAAARVRSRVGEYLQAQLELDRYPDVSFGQILQTTDIIPSFVHRWENYLRMSQLQNDPIFLPWHRYAALPADEFAKSAPNIFEELKKQSAEIPEPILDLFHQAPESMKQVAELYGQLFEKIEQEWQESLTKSREASENLPLRLLDPDAERVRQVLYAANSPCNVPEGGIINTEFFFDNATTIEIWKYQNEVDQLLIDSADALPFAVGLQDRQEIHEPRIFRRGNSATKSHEVARQTLQILGGESRSPFVNGSGRFELAQQIIHPDNPLTARVWVNRIWKEHFGTGLVSTPSDFGTRAEPPEHLELLDWLARRLIEQNWSTKAIQREILLSSTYKQQSQGPIDSTLATLAAEVDPQNRLLWRQQPRRLTFEEFRDSLLSASGELDLNLGGKSEPLFNGLKGSSNRRSLYGFINRQYLPGVYRVFDFANPDLHIPQRSETTISQQALFAMNHPFIADRAALIAESAQNQPDKQTSEQQIRWLFQRIFQRDPTPLQIEQSLEFLENLPPVNIRQEALAWQYGYGKIEVETGVVESFELLPYSNGQAWQGGENWPDKKLGWVQLTANGGHPGNHHDHAAIRRWTAPVDGVYSLQSLARHDVKAGNGIRCWIISNKQGVLKKQELHDSQQNMNVESIELLAGDYLDFVVDINGNLSHDQYLWTAEINLLPKNDSENPVGSNWNSQRDFQESVVKQLDPWGQLVQVLLLSNEFFFVD